MDQCEPQRGKPAGGKQTVLQGGKGLGKSAPQQTPQSGKPGGKATEGRKSGSTMKLRPHGYSFQDSGDETEQEPVAESSQAHRKRKRSAEPARLTAGPRTKITEKDDAERKDILLANGFSAMVTVMSKQAVRNWKKNHPTGELNVKALLTDLIHNLQSDDGEKAIRVAKKLEGYSLTVRASNKLSRKLSRYRGSTKPHYCVICEKSFTSDDALKNHVPIKHVLEPEVFQCPFPKKPVKGSTLRRKPGEKEFQRCEHMTPHTSHCAEHMGSHCELPGFDPKLEVHRRKIANWVSVIDSDEEPYEVSDSDEKNAKSCFPVAKENKRRKRRKRTTKERQKSEQKTADGKAEEDQEEAAPKIEEDMEDISDGDASEEKEDQSDGEPSEKEEEGNGEEDAPLYKVLDFFTNELCFVGTMSTIKSLVHYDG